MGFERHAQSPICPTVRLPDGVKSGAFGHENDAPGIPDYADLQRLIDAWPSLAADAKRRIMAIVREAKA